MERAYNRNVQAADRLRVVLLMPESEVRAVDAWAVPAGQPSRTAAIRHLVARGLETEASGGSTVGKALESDLPPI